MTKKLILLFAAVLMVASVNLSAQGQGVGGKRDTMRHTRFGIRMAENNLFPAHMLLRFKDEIGLDDAQVGKIEKMQEIYRESAIRSQADVKVKNMKLQSYLKSDQINRKKLETMIRDIAKLKTDMQIDRMNYLLDVKNILTKEQIAKIEEFKKTRREQRMKKRLERRGQRGMRQRNRF
jgi:Spy/CpxP family protein refolding chaperone